MKNLILPILCLFSLFCQAQSPQSLAVLSYSTLTVNNSSYLRIYNDVKDIKRIEYIDKKQSNLIAPFGLINIVL